MPDMPRPDRVMWREICEAGRKAGLPRESVGRYCQSGKDGDCIWANCPQTRDNEPETTGRHCPLDIHQEERGYQ